MTARRFEGRGVIVTGAAQGIGRAIAEAFLAEGARVAAVDRDSEGLARLDAEAIVTDLGEPGAAADAVADAERRLGRIHVLVNNAAVMPDGPIMDVREDTWDRAFAVNSRAVFFASQRAAQHFAEHGGGVIVNIASNAGIKSQPYSIAYCASKAGVVHLTRCLADEYIKRGVRANCVAPGGMETPLQQAFMEFPEGVDWKALRKVMSPLGNSQPEEIANVVAFIASDDCRYMTGSIVSIDGGITV